METVKTADIPKLLAQKIQPIIFQNNHLPSDRFLDDFAHLAVEVERRKAAAKLKKDA